MAKNTFLQGLQESQTAHRGPPRRKSLSYLERFSCTSAGTLRHGSVNTFSFDPDRVNRMGVVGVIEIFRQPPESLKSIPFAEHEVNSLPVIENHHPPAVS